MPRRNRALRRTRYLQLGIVREQRGQHGAVAAGQGIVDAAHARHVVRLLRLLPGPWIITRERGFDRGGKRSNGFGIHGSSHPADRFGEEFRSPLPRTYF